MKQAEWQKILEMKPKQFMEWLFAKGYTREQIAYMVAKYNKERTYEQTNVS